MGFSLTANDCEMDKICSWDKINSILFLSTLFLHSKKRFELSSQKNRKAQQNDLILPVFFLHNAFPISYVLILSPLNLSLNPLRECNFYNCI